ncbi:alpha/beta fold hydrolase [Gottfriedia sp. NPDC056225]|uniref:alpha/beta fold hydrolase n=1 Tax=Gottfriedia sp. NPDC056225 TaxID=3345751 RepID=UPI0035E34DB0
MNIIELDGANLHYHQIGQGPVLIFIPGANGTGDIFLPLAQHLKDTYTIVAIDRRGYGQSELTQPLPESIANPHDEYRVKRDAADIVALASHISDKPVYILGSSSGSIVAMHVLKEYPEIVKKIAFHEPPINTFLPDSQKWQMKNEEIVQTAINENMSEAMKIFGESLRVAPIDAESMSKPASSPESTKEIKRFEEMLNWFKYEIRQYTSSNITMEDFKPYLNRIILLNGKDSKGSFPQDVNQYISEQLNLPIVHISGGHLGYIQKPAGFAETLLSMW